MPAVHTTHIGSTAHIHHNTGTPLAQRTRSAAATTRRPLRVAAKIKDPDLDDEVAAIKGPPPIMWRVLAALTYLIPWIDVISLGREVYRNFPSTLWVYFFPGRSLVSEECCPWYMLFHCMMAACANQCACPAALFRPMAVCSV